MKKILLFTESIGSGGAERQLIGLAVMLKRNGYTVKVLTYFKSQFFEKYLEENDIEYLLDAKAFNRITRLYHIHKDIKEFAPDVIISYLSSPNKTVCLLKPFHNFKLIVSERNTTVKWGINEAILFNLYRLADYVVPNSFFEGTNIKEKKSFLKDKIIPITNFVDVEKFKPGNSIHNNIPLILCVGRLTEQKNILNFLEAISILKVRGLIFKVKWYGTHSYIEYSNKVHYKIKKLDLGSFIEIHEPSQNILEEYQFADIFCLPSIREGYPNVLCEAMSCGLPVVCSNVCENPKIVKDNVSGYMFDPLNVNDIANCIEKMLKLNISDRREMGLRNRENMINNNSMEVFVKKYIKIIEK